MKTFNDVKNALEGRVITDIKTTPRGIIIFAEGQSLQVDLYFSGFRAELNGDVADIDHAVDVETWMAVCDKFPDITVNGTPLHESSKKNPHKSYGAKEYDMSLHCKWAEKEGLLIGWKDVKSFDGNNITLVDGPRERGSK